jgi:hypothetical protein
VEDAGASSHRQILRNRKTDAAAVDDLKEGQPHA